MVDEGKVLVVQVIPSGLLEAVLVAPATVTNLAPPLPVAAIVLVPDV